MSTLSKSTLFCWLIFAMAGSVFNAGCSRSNTIHYVGMDDSSTCRRPIGPSKYKTTATHYSTGDVRQPNENESVIQSDYARLEKLKTEHLEAQVQLEALDKTIETLTSQKEDLDLDWQELKDQEKEYADELALLLKARDHLEAQIASLRILLGGQSEDNAKMEELKNEQYAAGQELKLKQKRIDEIRLLQEALKPQLDAARADFHVAELSLGRTEDKREDLRYDIDKRNEEIDELEGDLPTYLARFDLRMVNQSMPILQFTVYILIFLYAFLGIGFLVMYYMDRSFPLRLSFIFFVIGLLAWLLVGAFPNYGPVMAIPVLMIAWPTMSWWQYTREAAKLMLDKIRTNLREAYDELILIAQEKASSSKTEDKLKFQKRFQPWYNRYFDLFDETVYHQDLLVARDTLFGLYRDFCRKSAKSINLDDYVEQERIFFDALANSRGKPTRFHQWLYAPADKKESKQNPKGSRDGRSSRSNARKKTTKQPSLAN